MDVDQLIKLMRDLMVSELVEDRGFWRENVYQVTESPVTAEKAGGLLGWDICTVTLARDRAAEEADDYVKNRDVDRTEYREIHDVLTETLRLAVDRF